MRSRAARTCGRRTLIAFGGAAPLHAARVAEKLGIGRVLIPSNAGVGSAVGLLRAPVAYEIVRGRLMRLSSFDAAAANRLFGDDAQPRPKQIVRRGAPAAELTEQRSAFMRYRGQGHEIAVELAGARLDRRRTASPSPSCSRRPTASFTAARFPASRSRF